MRRIIAITLIWALPGAAMTDAFEWGEIDGLFDATASYGLLYRLEDADPDLIAVASGGRGRSADVDDGNLNYNTGIVSNVMQLSVETLLSWRGLGFYGRGIAFYDYENQEEDRARTEFDGAQKDLVGSDVELRESYMSLTMVPGGMPLTMRVGQQVVNWSETTFLREGLDLINPVDVNAAFRPVAEPRDFRIPQRMVWGAANITEMFAVEGYYQYEWEPLRLPPVGGYFSTLDLVGGAGVEKAVFGGGLVSDLGTDLDTRFALPPGTLGFDPGFQHMPGRARQEPDDGGQYGAALFAVLPVRNVIKTGVHYIRYHSRLPLVSGLTGDIDAVLATSELAVADQAAQLAVVYESEGLGPADAARLGRSASEELTLSGYANDAGYVVSYPEDIDAFALSFNTSTLRTGRLFAGEISHHKDYPFQIGLGTVLGAAFSPVLFDDSVGDTVLGDFGPSSVVPGFTLLDRTQATLEVAQVVRGRFYADQLLIRANLGWTTIHDMPSQGELPLTSDDDTSWGYGLILVAQFSSVFGGLNLAPRIGFSHDVEGTTPAPLSTYVEDRKSLRFGLGATFINRLSADLSYVTFFNGGRVNLLRDRDYLSFRVTLSL